MGEYKRHRVEVFAGPMFSKKTTELLNRLNELIYCPELSKDKEDIICFKPASNTRDAEIQSRYSVIKFPAISIPDDNPLLMLDYVRDHKVVGIDEAQFFRNGLAKTIRNLRDRGMMVEIAGLDTDFTGAPYNEMGEVLAIADHRPPMYGICKRDGNKSTRTQRLMLGQPAPYDSIRDIVQGSPLARLLGVDYETRCNKCHEVPTDPTFSQVLNKVIERLGIEDRLDSLTRELQE